MLTSSFKAWRNPLAFVRFGLVLQVVHASPRPGCHLRHRAGRPARCVPGLRDQAEDTGDAHSSAKLRPDILGISRIPPPNPRGPSSMPSSRDAPTARPTSSSRNSATPRSASSPALKFSVPAGANRAAKCWSRSFSSPASGNRAYFIARNLNFAKDQQPAKADMIKEVMDKYGTPTIVGDQHLYYIYRGGSIVSVGAKYKEAAALEAIDKPLDPRAALKLNGDTWPRQLRGRGQARAGARRSRWRALLDEAKGANCDGVLSVQFIPEHRARPRRHRPVHAARCQTRHQRSRDRRRGACRRTERTQRAAEGQRAETVARSP